jgi:hypothetical protein
MQKITLQDINKYITTIRIEYPNAFPIQAKDDKERAELYRMLCVSWYKQLEYYPKEICDTAVMNALGNARDGRYPRLGDVKYQIERIQEACQKSDNELWAELQSVLWEVAENVSLCRYETNEEKARKRNEEIFNSLSPEIKEYCQTVGGLTDIALYDMDKLGFERGRFIKAIPQIRERTKVRATIPETVKSLMPGETLLIGGKDEDEKKQGV